MFGRPKSETTEPKVVVPFAAEEPVEAAIPRRDAGNVLPPIPFSPNWAPSLATASDATVKRTPTLDERRLSEPGALPVIIAEDDPVSRELVRTLLEKWGYRVVVTSDGREAMEAVRAQTTPALAVLDWMMPGMDGLEICRRVREANKILYIILLTARGGKERLVEGLQAGADDYLMKPFDKDELRARLQVGARIIALHTTLAARVQELEAASSEIQSLKMRIPI